jgi:glycosyltransferase involved in cell wall biosynthesis
VRQAPSGGPVVFLANSASTNLVNVPYDLLTHDLCFVPFGTPERPVAALETATGSQPAAAVIMLNPPLQILARRNILQDLYFNLVPGGFWIAVFEDRASQSAGYFSSNPARESGVLSIPATEGFIVRKDLSYRWQGGRVAAPLPDSGCDGVVVTLERKLRSAPIFTAADLRAHRAVVYSRYLETLGGGERSSLDTGLALRDLGYNVEIVTDRPTAISASQLCAAFGVKDPKGLKVVSYNDEREMSQALARRGVDLFVNHTWGSFLPNPCRNGIYMLMFPWRAPAADIAYLAGYNCIACISPFTELYAKDMWGRGLPTRVISPPISGDALDEPEPSVERKDRLVLVVGRFNVDGHNKNQLDAIDTFCTLYDQGVLDSRWSLAVVGRVNQAPRSRAYLAQCRARAEGYPVEIHTDLPFSDLQRLYRRAALLWQFTGFGLDFGVYPEQCEHLGLVALDALAYGTIPVVYQRSGVGLMLSDGVDGFLFGDAIELTAVMRWFDRVMGSEAHLQMIKNGRQTATRFDARSFRLGLEDSIRNFPR